MSIPEINKEIKDFLLRTGMELPSDSSEMNPLKKMQNLFSQMTTLINTSEDAEIITSMTEFLDKITPEIQQQVDSQCFTVFNQVISAVHNKLEFLSTSPLLLEAVDIKYVHPHHIEELRLHSLEEITKIFDLDKWESTSDKEVVIDRIIKCFKNSSKNLILKDLDLSSLPQKFLQYLPQLENLELNNTQITTLTLPTTMNALTTLILYNNSQLTTLILPTTMDALTSIDLYNNSQLTTLTLPTTMNALPDLFLSQNSQLTTLTLRRPLKTRQWNKQ